MSTYNGENYLEEQIESLRKQKDVDIKILVRDDGSKDNTVKILEKYKKEGILDFYKGNNVGYAKSFLHLLTNNIEADYYAFCDQDDVWLPDKLIKAIEKINENEKPSLYASALKRVDENLKFLGIQSFKNLKLTLGAEFTRHRLAGCTFVFNKRWIV
nr:glycosyltransferase [Megamonas funiformis]